MSQEKIPLAAPDITDAEIRDLLAQFETILRTGQLSMGQHQRAFEAAVAEKAGRKYGIAVNSGTSGLHLCVRALGIGEGDEVITTPFSFIATTNCLLFERARPVFVDIDPNTYNMGPSAIEAAITPQTKAILPVEAFGNPAHFDEYERIAERHGLALIEDCCEALGAQLNGRPAGNFGQCGVFAFYPNKQITTGEGGLIVTDDEELRDLCVSLRNQGRATEEWLSHARLGYNYRMSEFQAALGASQVARLDQILRRRREIAEMYNRALGEVEEVHLPALPGQDQVSWFVYVIRLADRFSRDQRDSIISAMRDQGIGCNPYFVPIHLQPYIRKTLGTREGDFPQTERIAARTIALPFFAGMNESRVRRVRDVLRGAIAATAK